jgi:hypothetical protein
VKYAVIAAGLLCATPAMAQNTAVPQPKPVALSQRAAHPQAKRQPLPVVLPQEFAPPQEAYASFPQSDDAAAQAAPAAPSACQVSLAKVAEFQPLPVLVGPGDCGADDAVEMNAVTLADQSKVAVTPPAIMRCPMAQQVADWVRDDVASTLKGLPPLRGLDNLASYDCRGRNNVHAAKVSEHGRADALDVHDFKLADGRELGLTDVNIGAKRCAPAPARGSQPCSVRVPTATTRSTSISISNRAATITRSANGTSAFRRQSRRKTRVRTRRRPQRLTQHKARNSRKARACRCRVSMRRRFRKTRCPCRGRDRSQPTRRSSERCDSTPTAKKEPGFAPDSLSR